MPYLLFLRHFNISETELYLKIGGIASQPFG